MSFTRDKTKSDKKSKSKQAKKSKSSAIVAPVAPANGRVPLDVRAMLETANYALKNEFPKDFFEDQSKAIQASLAKIMQAEALITDALKKETLSPQTKASLTMVREVMFKAEKALYASILEKCDDRADRLNGIKENLSLCKNTITACGKLSEEQDRCATWAKEAFNNADVTAQFVAEVRKWTNVCSDKLNTLTAQIETCLAKPTGTYAPGSPAMHAAKPAQPAQQPVQPKGITTGPTSKK